MQNHRTNNVIEADFTLGSGAFSGTNLNPLSRSDSPASVKNPLAQSDRVQRGMAESVASQFSALRAEKSAIDEHNAKPRGLIDRLLGRAPAKLAMSAHSQNMLSTVWAHEERCLKLATDALYEDAREKVNTWLSARKLDNREELIAYATAKLQKLKETLEQRRVEFGQLMRGRVQRLQGYTDMPLLAEAEFENIQEEVRKQIKLLADLEEHFTNAVKERVG